VDYQTPAQFARDQAPSGMPLQGNLDPQLLVAGGALLEQGVRDVLAAFQGGPHIFNLGHGITPDATPESLAQLVRFVKGAA
jgi:uroporphyrinogen decarboxylase